MIIGKARDKNYLTSIFNLKEKLETLNDVGYATMYIKDL